MMIVAVVTVITAMPAVLTGGDGAPPPAGSFVGLMELIELEEDVTVVYGSDQVVKGRAVAVSVSGLDVVADGVRLELKESDVLSILQRRRDPLWNGGLAGFVAGAAPWVGLWSLGGGTGGDTEADVGAAIVTGLFGVAGLLVGVILDARKVATHEIYRAPDVSAKGRLSLGLVVTGGRRGAALSVSW